MTFAFKYPAYLSQTLQSIAQMRANGKVFLMTLAHTEWITGRNKSRTTITQYGEKSR